MQQKFLVLVMVSSLLLIAACSDNSVEQTLAVENAALSTQITDLRITATYQADELKRTEEYVKTAIPQVNRLRDELSSTLQAAGIDGTAIAQVQPNINYSLATAPATGQASSIPVAPPTNSTPDSLDLSLPTLTVSQSGLFNLVLAEGVGSNDCALASTTSFASTTAQIYVVATAANITAGSTLGAQWYMDSTLLTTQDFSPKDDINNNCIWFYVEPSDFPFTPGNYRVDLSIDGTPVTGAQASFTIAG